MGYSSWFCIEAKSSEFMFEVDVLILRVFERDRGPVCLIFLSKVIVSWLLDTMESLFPAEGAKEFLKFSRVGSKAFIIQYCAIKFGCFLVVMEYGGGG